MSAEHSRGGGGVRAPPRGFPAARDVLAHPLPVAPPFTKRAHVFRNGVLFWQRTGLIGMGGLAYCLALLEVGSLIRRPWHSRVSCLLCDQLRAARCATILDTGQRPKGKRRNIAWLVLKEIIRAAPGFRFFSACVVGMALVIIVTSKPSMSARKKWRREVGGPACSDCKRQSSNSRGNILPPPLMGMC
jgi:hypothetical protein